ncbi:MAG: GMP/IMP nucleotidase [Gammaproteobacteria bacterium]|nr:GMP/IMP nucleotidase [Gammaproteobacteria bacterium]NNF49568.1 GMP/IMP nucleotidase [Woeseiaceae bacterium]MBT8093862.1 GMP/IMP nucleotidase [Gammaproteobacteria bacterium]MBT8105947.1 GMP/IMP nucleotidase [Gammaproteobacteria bacterium]NNK25961.1 GMP/IMP nucleotidase [Woeseiaceae bacterium]
MNITPQEALERCETLMLDMDGTILDLAFDNFVWLDLVPRRYAAANNMTYEEAREKLIEKYRSVQGDLSWYCLDHWNDRLGIDVVKVHHDVTYRIGYLPGALEFLRKLRELDKRVLLVTNSHPDTLELKDAVTGLGDYFDGMHSSHAYGHAKESQSFWRALRDDVGFDIGTTLFVDDSQPVLRSAQDYGVRMLVTVTRPATTEPVRHGSDFRGVEGIGDLLD